MNKTKSDKDAITYLDNFIQFAKDNISPNGTVNHTLLHLTGNMLVEDFLGISKSSIDPLNSKGANSLLFKTDSSFIKLGYSVGRYSDEEPDDMILESIANNFFRKIVIPKLGTRNNILSGLKCVWKMPGKEANSYTSKYNYSARRAFYDVAYIDSPVTNATSMYSLIVKNQLYQYHTELIRFVQQLLKIIYMYGFTHNDLHPGNVLYDHSHNRFMMIDLGRSYMCSSDYDAVLHDMYGNEYVKLSPPKVPVEKLSILENRSEKILTLADLIKIIRPTIDTGDGWMKPMPKSQFAIQTYGLFDLIALFKGTDVFIETDNKLKDYTMNGIDHYTNYIERIHDFVIKNRNSTMSSIERIQMIGKMIDGLLRYWYIHYVYTYVKLIKEQLYDLSEIKTELKKYEINLFFNSKGSVWLRTETFVYIVDRFYSDLEPYKRKIEDILIEITNTPTTGSKSSSTKKGGMMEDTYDDYGDILVNIDLAKDSLRRETDNSRKIRDRLFRRDTMKQGSVIKALPSYMPSGIPVQDGGSDRSTIAYDGKTRKIYTENGFKYIVINKQKVYLRNIKGKYRYV